MPDSFTFRDLGETIARILDLHLGDSIEIKRDKTDVSRVMVVKLVD